ncbi:MAG: type I-E CRISPR-associated protein Cse2/CasB [Chlorobiales bacterium]|nr:type I-E CRISPR-associated protein Cse2/CasB [Chlorobiales bacterium]
MEKDKLPEYFMALYDAWKHLAPGAKAELRRIAKPSELIEVPAFYRLYSGKAHTEWDKQGCQRLIYCLPFIKHITEDVGLGRALASGKRVSEKRLFQVIRSESPNDMIQLRRVLQMVEPSANWVMAAKTLWYWNYDRTKRNFLEDYFINVPK